MIYSIYSLRRFIIILFFFKMPRTSNVPTTNSENMKTTSNATNILSVAMEYPKKDFVLMASSSIQPSESIINAINLSMSTAEIEQNYVRNFFFFIKPF